MAEKSVYMGVYSRTDFPAGEDAAPRRWNVWSLNTGGFLVQPIDESTPKPANLVKISAELFFTQFRVITSDTLPQNSDVAIPGFNVVERTAKTADDPSRESAAQHHADESPQCDPAEPPFLQGSPRASITPARSPSSQAPNAAEQDLESLLFTMSADEPEAPSDSGESPSIPAPTSASARLSTGDDHAVSSDGGAVFEQKEAEVRASFSLALINLTTNKDAAVNALKTILEDRGPFFPEAKYVFSDFGLSLRRRHLLDLACLAHEKAHELAPADEHILFNLARSLYDSGRYREAEDRLRQALAIAPDFKPGLDFLHFLEQSENRSS